MTQILIRRGTAATWTSNNPVLGLGEIGYETDTKKAKMGDGSTTWNSLGYWIPTLPTGAVVGTTDSQTLTNKTISGASNTIQNIPTSALFLNGAASATVIAYQTTTSTSYTDLATTTDQVTINIGSSGLALVSMSSTIWTSITNTYATVSFNVSGANNLGLQHGNGRFLTNKNLYPVVSSATWLMTGLSTGSTTFKMKYAADSGTTAHFSDRHIAVVPL